MQPLPHRYTTTASAAAEGDVSLSDTGLPELACAPPQAFGGPGDRWSPETLLCAAVASCFILTFRAVARANDLAWTALDCAVEGTLDRQAGQTAFTAFTVQAVLDVAPGTDPAAAQHALERAEHSCLVSNSLHAPVTLATTVRGAGDRT